MHLATPVCPTGHETLRASGTLDGLDRLALEVGGLVPVENAFLMSLIHGRGQLLHIVLCCFSITSLGGLQRLLPQRFHLGAKNLVAIGPTLDLPDPLKGRF